MPSPPAPLSQAGEGSERLRRYQGFADPDVLLPEPSLNPTIRRTREGGYPLFSAVDWIPAGAGMTESESPDYSVESTCLFIG